MKDLANRAYESTGSQNLVVSAYESLVTYKNSGSDMFATFTKGASVCTTTPGDPNPRPGSPRDLQEREFPWASTAGARRRAAEPPSRRAARRRAEESDLRTP